MKTIAAISMLLASVAVASEPAKKVTYEDDVLPIFRDNCLKCHNPDKLKGDLDLSSFSATVKGGGSGTTLNAGDPDGSQLFKSVTHADEPSMPPNSKLSAKEIAIIRSWIEGGLLQGVNSKALIASKPAVDLSLKSAPVGKPDGPPPMPGGLPLEPVVQAARGSALSALAHSPWAPVVALAGAKQIVLYNTASQEFAGVLPFSEGFPCDVKFSRNGKLLLAAGGHGGKSGEVVVWDITTGQRVITIGDQFDAVLAADLSSDQRWIALGGPDRVLKIYRTSDGSLEHKSKKHTEWVTAVEFSPNAKYLATGDRNGGLVLWEAESGQEMFTLSGHKGAITAITWRSDSEMVLSASEDGSLKLWKASDGSALKNIPAHKGGTLAANFAHDGRIVSAGRDDRIQIWETSGKPVRGIPFKGELPNRVAFSDDGTKVIASDWQGRVMLWDAKSGKTLGELEANPPTLAVRVKAATRQLAALEADLVQALAAVDAAKPETTPAPKRAEARKKADALQTKVTAAKAALARWQNAQQAAAAAKAKSGDGKITLR
jgi:mono/diheme cytochrome c family protein